MICRNCGFQNAEGDEFCGSCGQFLEWSGEPAAGDAAGVAGAGAGGAAGGTDFGAFGSPPPPPPAPQPRVDAAAPTKSFPMPPSTQATPPGGLAGSSAGFGGADVICWNCQRRNPPSRSFCQQCGERLTTGVATGTVGGAAGVGMAASTRAPAASAGNRNLLLGGALLLLLLLVSGGAFVLFGGLASPTATPFGASGSPRSSGIAGSLSPSPSSGSPSGSGGSPSPTIPGTTSAPPSGEPTPSPSDVPTDEPSASPTDTPTATPTKPPPTPTPTGIEVGRFNCKTQTLKDGSPTRWKILGNWQVLTPGSYDRLVLTIQRTPTKAPNMPVITAKIVPADEVQSLYGVPNPKRGDKALVVILPPPIVFGGVLANDKDRAAIEGFRVTGKGSGNTYAVLGLNATSCYDISSPEWGPGVDPPDTSHIWIDVRRP